MKFLACFLLISLTAAASEVSQSAEFQDARRIFYLGADGDKAKYEEADKLFSKLYSRFPTDPAVMVYFGSLRLLEASHTWALWRKNSLSKQGIQLIDSAVDAAPGDLEIRFLRAATTYELPAFFHREQQSRSDFDYLAQRAVEAARQGNFDPRLAAASLYYRAEFLHRDGKTALATPLWRQAILIAPGSRGARDSANELKKLGI